MTRWLSPQEIIWHYQMITTRGSPSNRMTLKSGTLMVRLGIEFLESELNSYSLYEFLGK
jgi:hypothetical protein